MYGLKRSSCLSFLLLRAEECAGTTRVRFTGKGGRGGSTEEQGWELSLDMSGSAAWRQEPAAVPTESGSRELTGIAVRLRKRRSLVLGGA